jgi:hypothetical protein
MSDIRSKYVPPAVSETAFNCAHCGALALQYWYQGYMEFAGKDEIPKVYTVADLENMDWQKIEPSERPTLKANLRRMTQGLPVIEKDGKYADFVVHNLWISKCYNCSEMCIWLHDKMIWPVFSVAPLPNPDIPDDVKLDYNEAGVIINLSPRGAAALLRLAIQKLCKHLGQKGKDINEDIAAMVKVGLDVRVQQALDVVRVIGNNAVHPGQIDLRDDKATAERLFALVNLITEITISQPKHIKSMYEKLPDNALKAIEKRDQQKQ